MPAFTFIENSDLGALNRSGVSAERRHSLEFRFAPGRAAATLRFRQRTIRRWTTPCLLLACAVTLAGCVSKAKADARTRAAFIAGQQRAMMELQQNQNRGPLVTFMGPVRNRTIPWTLDLTLAKALVAAQYEGMGDPLEVVLIRSGEARHINVQQLLNGLDVPLQPQDVVEIKAPAQFGNSP